MYHSAMADALDGMPRITRRAVECHRLVAGQVRLLNQNCGKDDARFILDTQAVLWSMDVHEVPKPEQAETWNRIMALHEVAYQGADADHRLCVEHVQGDGPLAAPSCWKCRRWYGLDRDGAA